MNKYLWVVISALLFIVILAVGGWLILSNHNTTQVNDYSKVKSGMYELVENAYFEGQKDALEGDVRIKKSETGWVWVKSPWNDGTAPTYDPSKDPEEK